MTEDTQQPSEAEQTSSGELPSCGQLEEGVTGAMLLEAIRKSGYPFQAEVANKLALELKGIEYSHILQEEWAYIDSESDVTRSLDILLEVDLLRDEDGRRNFRSAVDLLIECKQSSYPLVFFLRNKASSSKIRHPEIFGLPHDKLRIFSGDDHLHPEFSFYMPIHDVLGSYDFGFCDLPVPFAVSFAKARRKGAKLELAGDDTYQSITLPLIKAADHLKRQCKSPEGGGYVDLRFVACVAVVRAPMIGTYLHEGTNILLSTPWVRAARMEPTPTSSRLERDKFRYFDIVHYDYLSTYIRRAITELSELADRAAEISTPLREGYGITSGNGDPLCSCLTALPDDYKQYLELEATFEIAHMGGVELGFEFPTGLADENEIHHFAEEAATKDWPRPSSKKSSTIESEE